MMLPMAPFAGEGGMVFLLRLRCVFGTVQLLREHLFAPQASLLFASSLPLLLLSVVLLRARVVIADFTP